MSAPGLAERRDLQAALPPAAFAPAPYKLWYIAGHGAVVALGYAGIRAAMARPGARWWALPLIALVIGHSLACIAFLCHELSHNAIVRRRQLREPLESALWALNWIPATMWRRVHNHSHHGHANSPQDPDRPYLESERSTIRTAYAALFMPARQRMPWNPLVLVHFVTYIARHTVSVFYAGTRRPAIVTFKPTYRARERRRVVGELVWMALLQSAIWQACGSWTGFFFGSVGPAAITSAIVMLYVFTNHFLQPVGDDQSTLETTTSVVVPRVFDRLHFNFSHHTEHHLFPSLNSDYYPQVAAALRQRHADRYHVLPITTAWQALWRIRRFRPIGGNPFVSTGAAQIRTTRHRGASDRDTAHAECQPRPR